MKKDFFKQLYPLTKLFLSLTLILSAFIVPSYIYGYSMIIICGIIVSLENKSKVYCKRIFFSLFWLFTAIFIIQSIFLPSGEVWMKFGFISIYKEGVMKAVNLTSKLTAVVSALTMLTLITPVKTFTLALEKKGLNPKAAFILMLTLQMIPEMKKQANVIMDSQKARGVETEGNVFVRAKALIPVFIPLVLSSIANTEERAIMLEARGFSIGEKRTILYDIEETKNDKIMKIIISKQKKFFTSQGKKINTLKISDIANELNLSSSTVSRAVKEKYIKTDFGIISLRKLFNLDSTVFLHKKKILEYIENENKEQPLSDQDIVNLLKKDGIKIARRTVTKYREKLGYKSSHKRKKY